MSFLSFIFGQAEFQNIIDSVSLLGKVMCVSASICWIPPGSGSQEASFVLGFNSNSLQLNSPKVCLIFLVLLANFVCVQLVATKTFISALPLCLHSS